jgi:hypothetical protein
VPGPLIPRPQRHSEGNEHRSPPRVVIRQGIGCRTRRGDPVIEVSQRTGLLRPRQQDGTIVDKHLGSVRTASRDNRERFPQAAHCLIQVTWCPGPSPRPGHEGDAEVRKDLGPPRMIRRATPDGLTREVDRLIRVGRISRELESPVQGDAEK